MPGPFAPPQPSVAPTVSATRSRFGAAYLRGGAEMAEARSLQQLGGLMIGMAGERIAKEDRYQLTRAKSQYMADSERWTYDFLHSDLSAVDKQGRLFVCDRGNDRVAQALGRRISIHVDETHERRYGLARARGQENFFIARIFAALQRIQRGCR